jgi:hypothetical protein
VGANDLSSGTFLWFLGALAGVAATYVPELIIPGAGNDGERAVILGATFFLLGGSLGAMAPTGMLRWGLAATILVPVVDVARSTMRLPELTMGVFMKDLLPILRVNFVKYMVLLVLATVGSAVARNVRKRF